ncbi:VOC family protein, partial [Aetokthonos hydrillicola]
MIQVQKIQAIRLTVTSADQAKNFYTQAFDCKTVSDLIFEGQNYGEVEGLPGAKIRIVTLLLGNELIRLIEYLNIKGRLIPKDSQSNDLWFQHIAIVVSDMDHAYTRLQSFPIDPISTQPQTIPPDNEASAGVRAFKFKDPDRHNLELIWFPPDKGGDKWHRNNDDRLFLGIDHSAIAVANTEDSLKFYHDLLGMEVKQASLNHGETQAHLDGLSEAKVRVTPLRPIKPSLG